jgi:hypothetical protein
MRGEKAMNIERLVLPFCILAIAGLALGIPGLAQQSADTQLSEEEARAKAHSYQGSQSPPTSLQRTSDGHWTPYSPPEEPPEGAEVYVIQQGDTLSGIAQSRLGDSYLWPLIWDINPYILDAHWIYPGDPLFIRTSPMVISEDMPVDPEEEEEERGPELFIEETAALPPIYIHDLECSGFIDTHFKRPSLEIASSEERVRESLAEGFVVYLNEGSNSGIQQGDKFYVLRVDQVVHHPVSGEAIGRYIHRIGQVKVIAVKSAYSAARIIQSCDEIRYNDPLLPYEIFPIPFDVAPSDEIPILLPESGKSKGRIIWTADRLGSLGKDSVAYIDLGAEHNLIPGDKLWVYRHPSSDGTLVGETRDLFRQSKLTVEERDLFRPQKRAKDTDYRPVKIKDERIDDTVHNVANILGELVVLTTGNRTACVKFIKSEKEMHIGDWVQIQ